MIAARRRRILLAAGIAAGLLLAAVVGGPFQSPSDRHPGDAATERAATKHAAPAASAGTRGDTASPAALVGSPPARAALAAHADRQRFEKRLRDFFAHADALEPAERERIAVELDAQVEAEELARRMSADEARMLRLALIERRSVDAAERLRHAEALADAYRLEAERRRRAFEQQQATDPAFVAYKAREAQVVAEVAAMRTVPGGLRRDEYLRQRLQAERERAYALNPGG